jgi:hypothetical protein
MQLAVSVGGLAVVNLVKCSHWSFRPMSQSHGRGQVRALIRFEI